jgi:hypothetical protein
MSTSCFTSGFDFQRARFLFSLKFVWQEASRNPHTPQRTRRVLHLEKQKPSLLVRNCGATNRLSQQVVFFAPQMLRSEISRSLLAIYLHFHPHFPGSSGSLSFMSAS